MEHITSNGDCPDEIWKVGQSICVEFFEFWLQCVSLCDGILFSKMSVFKCHRHGLVKIKVIKICRCTLIAIKNRHLK